MSTDLEGKNSEFNNENVDEYSYQPRNRVRKVKEQKKDNKRRRR